MLVVSWLQCSVPVLICFSLVLVFTQLLDGFNDRALRPIPGAPGRCEYACGSARKPLELSTSCGGFGSCRRDT
jgi:hypothetical protein